MAERLVDGGEAVEIADQDERFEGGARGVREHLTQTVVKERPVGQPGERVGKGEPLDHGFALTALGHIPHQADASADLPCGRAQCAHLALDPAIAAVGGRDRTVVVCRLAAEGRAADVDEAGDAFVAERLSGEQTRLGADERLEAFVHLLRDEIRVEDHRAQRGLFEEYPLALAGVT